MKLFLAALLLAPVAFAAPKTGKSNSANNAPVIKANLKGLSAYVNMDMADSFDYSASEGNQSGSGSFGSERAFGFGAVYTFARLENGIGLQGGGSFEMGRVISNVKTNGGTQNFQGAKPEIQYWTAYGQATANLTPELAVYGGGNYSLPQVKNISGGSWKGGFGYQFGATYAVTPVLALAGEYRTLNMSGSANNQQTGQTTNYDNIRLQGFSIRGLYAFE